MALPDTVLRRPSTFDAEALLTDSVDQVVTATGTQATPVHVGAGATFEIKLTAKSIGGTTPTLDFVVQEADDAAFTTPVVMATFRQIDDSADPAVQQKAHRAEKEYIRGDWTVSGAGATFTTTCSIVV